MSEHDPAAETTAARAPGGQMVLNEDQAMEILAYLASAAELCLREPDYYGTLRLLDGASRLMNHMLAHDPERIGPFLREFKSEVDEKKVWSMWDREAFRDFARTTPAIVATEIRRLQDQDQDQLENNAEARS